MRFEWRRERVLDAAERVFAAKGLQAATMRDIAAEAAYAVGTLYRFVPSKEALCVAVIERGLPEVTDFLLARAQEAASPLARLDAYVQAFFEFFESKRSFLQLFTHVGGPHALVGFDAADQSEVARVVEISVERVRDFLTQTVAQAIDASEIEAGDPRMLAISFVAILSAFAGDWVITEPGRPLSELAHETRAVLGRLLSPTPRYSGPHHAPDRPTETR